MHIVQLTLANSSVTNKSTHNLSYREAPTEMVNCRTRDATNAQILIPLSRVSIRILVLG
jgi:hypothetical protein